MSETPSSESQNFESENTDKVERYKEMVGDSRAIFILSASEREIGKSGKKYRPDSYGDLDNKSLLAGGHARVIAAAEIGNYFPDIKLITDSAPEKAKESLAKIYADELKRLGISEAQIDLEERSTDTITELAEMMKIARINNWEKVAVLTSGYHVERVSEMLSHLKEIIKNMGIKDGEFDNAWEYFDGGNKLEVRFLSAEEILPLRNIKYQEIIDKVRDSESYKKRVASEKRGIQQIREGTYGVKNKN